MNWRASRMSSSVFMRTAAFWRSLNGSPWMGGSALRSSTSRRLNSPARTSVSRASPGSAAPAAASLERWPSSFSLACWSQVHSASAAGLGRTAPCSAERPQARAMRRETLRRAAPRLRCIDVLLYFQAPGTYHRAGTADKPPG
jgi:hypothetical protein